jgi:hypothetical protein
VGLSTALNWLRTELYKLSELFLFSRLSRHSTGGNYCDWNMYIKFRDEVRTIWCRTFEMFPHGTFHNDPGYQPAPFPEEKKERALPPEIKRL